MDQRKQEIALNAPLRLDGRHRGRGADGRCGEALEEAASAREDEDDNEATERGGEGDEAAACSEPRPRCPPH
jgi:hypothetical protein